MDFQSEAAAPRQGGWLAEFQPLCPDADASLVPVLDLRGAALSFADVLRWLDAQAEAQPDAGHDLRRWPVVVGPDRLIGLAVRKARQHFNIEAEWFPTLDEALAFVQGTSRSPALESRGPREPLQ